MGAVSVLWPQVECLAFCLALASASERRNNLAVGSSNCTFIYRSTGECCYKINSLLWTLSLHKVIALFHLNGKQICIGINKNHDFPDNILLCANKLHLHLNKTSAWHQNQIETIFRLKNTNKKKHTTLTSMSVTFGHQQINSRVRKSDITQNNCALQYTVEQDSENIGSVLKLPNHCACALSLTDKANTAFAFCLPLVQFCGGFHRYRSLPTQRFSVHAL